MARVGNRLLAGTVALTLGAGALVAVLELGALLWGRDRVVLDYDHWLQLGRSLTWADPGVRAGFGAALVAGAALLVLQLARRRPELLALGGGEGTLSASLDRRSLEHALGRAAQAIDGVGSARTRVHRRRVSITITPRWGDGDELAENAREVAAVMLEDMCLVHEPRLRVKVAPKRGGR